MTGNKVLIPLKESPLVTVIVPIYNVADYLPKCIDSLINQTYNNLEIFLINDGSTDICGEICNNYANRDIRIRVFHKTNGGQSSARNIGLHKANGKYVNFIDSDDWVDFDFYEKLVTHAEINHLDVCVCGRKEFDGFKLEKTVSVNSSKNLFIDFPHYFSNYFFQPFTPVVWNKIYLRKHIVENSISFKSVHYVGTEDTLFNFDFLLFANKVGSVEDVFYNHLIRKGSTALAYSSGAISRTNNLIVECNKKLQKEDKDDASHRAVIAYILIYFVNLHVSKIKDNFVKNQKVALEKEMSLITNDKVLRKYSIEIVKSKKVTNILKKKGYKTGGIITTKLIYWILFIGNKKLFVQMISKVFKFN
jgi:glycosyltransferase involved in cell wall biosynthesis